MEEVKQNLKKPVVILLDVYETLLDMSEVERKVNNLLDSKRGYIVWFELFMQYCFVDNCTVQFNDFTSIGKATLKMAAKTFDVHISEASSESLLELLKHLPLKDEVQNGLSELSNQNFRIAALTNAAEHTVWERMERTGLISYFEAVLSAEHVKKYKPCIEVYQWAAKKLGEEPQNILMVSAHGWDIAGAANSGMQTAYIKSDRELFYPLAPEPTILIKNIKDLSAQLEALSDMRSVGNHLESRPG